MTRECRSSLTLSISSTACAACCVSFCRQSSRSNRTPGTHDPHPHGRSVAVPSSSHLDGDRDQLYRLSDPEQHELVGATTFSCSLRIDSRALPRTCRRRELDPCARRLRSLPHDDVPAWRLAAHHLQHVDALAVRADDRGSIGAWPI